MASRFWEPRPMQSAWSWVERASRIRYKRTRRARSRSGKARSMQATSRPLAIEIDNARIAQERVNRLRRVTLGIVGFGR